MHHKVIGDTRYYLAQKRELSAFEYLFYHTLPPFVRRYLVIHPSLVIGIEGTILRQDNPSFLFITSNCTYILDARLHAVKHYENIPRVIYHHIEDVSVPFLYVGDPLTEIEKIPRYRLYVSRDDVRCIHEVLRAYLLPLHREDNPHITIEEYRSMKLVTFRYHDLKIAVRVFSDGRFHYRWHGNYYHGGHLEKR